MLYWRMLAGTDEVDFSVSQKLRRLSDEVKKSVNTFGLPIRKRSRKKRSAFTTGIMLFTALPVTLGFVYASLTVFLFLSLSLFLFLSHFLFHFLFHFLSLSVNHRGRKVYWISFMDGLQRVLLLTASQDLQKRVGAGGAKESPHTELTLSLIGTGLSLVDDLRGQEVAFIGIPQYVLHRSFHMPQ